MKLVVRNNDGWTQGTSVRDGMFIYEFSKNVRLSTNLLDKNGDEICVGDAVDQKGCGYSRVWYNGMHYYISQGLHFERLTPELAATLEIVEAS